MKAFEFDVTVEKAWKDDKGTMFVRAIASDDRPDAQRDRMTEMSLGRMAEQFKKGLPLLETHRSVFGFGKTIDGGVVKKEGTHVLQIDVELDARYPQSTQLFDEVHSGRSDKQLSIGGRINSKNPQAVRFEETKEGTVRAVDDVILDHVATTRKGQAANDRTKFVSAILKSLDEEDEPETVEKKVVPFRKFPVLEEAGWDWSGPKGQKIQQQMLDKGWGTFRDAHAWFDPAADPDNPDAPQVKTAYKLPHHWLVGGDLRTQFPGTTFAMAALMGARGGVAIPKAEAQGVWSHLAQHMRDNNMEPPAFDETIFAEKRKDKPWSCEEFAKWMEEKNGVNVESFGVTKDWWGETWPYWTTKEEHEAMLTKAAGKKNEPPTDSSAAQAAVRGLSFLAKLGRALGVGGDVDKEVTMSTTKDAPPAPGKENLQPEVGAPSVPAAPATPVVAKTEPAPATKPEPAKPSVGQRVRDLVAKFVGGALNQASLVQELRSVLTAEKSTAAEIEDGLFDGAAEEVSKGLVGKKRLARLAEINSALTAILAELAGQPATQVRTEPPPAPATTEKTVPFDPAQLEKDMAARFGEALQKTLGDFEKGLSTTIEKTLAEKSVAIQKSVDESTAASKDALTMCAGMAERLDQIEKAGGVPQGLQGEDAPPEAAVQKDRPWRNMFARSIAKAQRRM